MFMFMNCQKSTIENISIKDCRHFRGYRYGLFSNNLYEDYLYDLKNNCDINEIRLKFIRRILGTRTTHFAETLGINLTKNYANWDYPWNALKTTSMFSPSKNPDIVCHASQNGVLVSHINREFKWLEDAYLSIGNNNYLPKLYGYITVLRLKFNNRYSFLVLDGNHRISALAASGETHCLMNVFSNFSLNNKLWYLWFGLLFRGYAKIDAQAILSRYFWENNPVINESNDFSLLIYDEPLLNANFSHEKNY